MRNLLSETAVRPDTLYPPYNNLIKTVQRGDWTTENLIEVVGVGPVTAAMQASASLPETSKNFDWIRLLENAHAMYTAGVELEKVAKKLIHGEEADLSMLNSIAQKAMSGQGKLTPASKITAREVPFIRCGYKPLDDHMGGLPAVGLTVVAGATKSGKTTFAVRLVDDFLHLYEDKYVCYFSIESLGEELKMRMKEVDPKLEYVVDTGTGVGEVKQDVILERWLIHDGPVTPEQVLNISAQVEHLGMVVIDFADLMITGEASESKYAAMYTTLMLAAKKLGVPIILLAQFNRQYDGGIPRPNYIRYTGLAEALSWMLITLWNPEISYHADNEDADEEDLELPILDGYAYMIIWLCRGGFRVHPDEAPGAVAIKFRGDIGWDYLHSGKWYSMKKEPKRKRTRR